MRHRNAEHHSPDSADFVPDIKDEDDGDGIELELPSENVRANDIPDDDMDDHQADEHPDGVLEAPLVERHKDDGDRLRNGADDWKESGDEGNKRKQGDIGNTEREEGDEHEKGGGEGDN